MSEPIRILCVFSSLNRGGAETMCMNIYRHIDKTKIQFDFIKHTHDECSFESEIKGLGGRIIEAPQYKIYNHLSYRMWWEHFLTAHPEYTIIHAHFYTIASVFFPIALKHKRITICHCHSTNVKGNRITAAIKRNMIKKNERYAHVCFACSEKSGEWLFPHREFKVIKNAIDTSAFVFSEEKARIARKELDLKNEFILGHVGNFLPVKNHTFLIDVFKLIHDTRPDSKLIMVGSGDNTVFWKKVDDLGLRDSVIFTGERNDVETIIQAFDAFVFPSLSEGLPVTIIEAQAAGLKCFLSDRITPEVDLTGRCIFLPLTDPQIWAESILNTDISKIDTSEQIKRSGYDIHTTTKKIEKFYLKLSETAQ